jgi:dTDP-L-rhamnose 4-epimerase
VKRVTTPAPTADIVLPCLDEAAALPWVLGRVPPGWRAIVVDNGSTDGSARIAEEHGALVVREPVRGFGSACHAGLLAATADLVCFCDCDGSLDPALLPGLAAPVTAGDADLVLGRRRPTTFGAWPLHARLANLELARLIRRRTGLRLHDLGPMRVARRAALGDLRLTDRRSGYPLQMVVRAADAGWRVTEHDVPYAPRAGRSKVTGTWRGTWHAVRDMAAVLQEPPEPGAEPSVPGAELPVPGAGPALAAAPTPSAEATAVPVLPGGPAPVGAHAADARAARVAEPPAPGPPPSPAAPAAPAAFRRAGAER